MEALAFPKPGRKSSYRTRRARWLREFRRACMAKWEQAADKHGVRRCEKCGRVILFPRPHNFHHKDKRSHGGENTPENLDLTCAGCHDGEHGIVAVNGEWRDL